MSLKCLVACKLSLLLFGGGSGILLLLVIMDYKCLKRLKVISRLRILRVATLCYSNPTVAAVAV